MKKNPQAPQVRDGSMLLPPHLLRLCNKGLFYRPLLCTCVSLHTVAGKPLSQGRLFFFCFLRLHLQHMELPRLGVESEL